MLSIVAQPIVPQARSVLPSCPILGHGREVTIHEEQQQQLKETIRWAQRIRAELQPILEAHGERVHFRPSSGGVAMVGLLPDRPQRGKSRIRDLSTITADFEKLFGHYCRPIGHGRATPEKALQSWLIRDAYA